MGKGEAKFLVPASAIERVVNDDETMPDAVDDRADVNDVLVASVDRTRQLELVSGRQR